MNDCLTHRLSALQGEEEVVVMSWRVSAQLRHNLPHQHSRTFSELPRHDDFGEVILNEMKSDCNARLEEPVEVALYKKIY